MGQSELKPNPMSEAPKDGTMLRLFVQYDEDNWHPLEDADQAWTVGANNYDHDGEDEWKMAGWSWTQDCFTEGAGTPIGWLPFHDAEQVERDGYDQFWGAVEDAPHRHVDTAQVIDTLRSAWLVRDLMGNDFDLARAKLDAMLSDAREEGRRSVTEWNDISTAPYETTVMIRVGSGMQFEAKLSRDGSVDESGDDCDQWVAAHDGEHPPCWSGGECWGSNEDDTPSMPPNAWRALTDAEPRRSVTVAEAARVLLSRGPRSDVYDACENRVKVYKFDAVLRALSGEKTE